MMATIPVYTTFVAGTILTAAQLNTQVVAAGGFLLGPPECSVFNAAGVVTVSGTSIVVPFDNELEDTDNMHSTSVNPSRIIFQTLGWYALTPFSGFPSNATGARQLQLRLNAAGAIGAGTKLMGCSSQAHLNSEQVTNSVAWRYRAVNIGDYFEMFITQFTTTGQTTGAGTNGCFVKWESI